MREFVWINLLSISYILTNCYVYTVDSKSLEQIKKIKDIQSWPGKWFPHKPEITDENEYNLDNSKKMMSDIKNPECDNALDRLQIDWYNDPINHTCFDMRSLYEPNATIYPHYDIEEIPPLYKAAHFCMNESLHYDSNIPSFGNHRPLWPQWGEYIFLPKQRWLHSLEHGGIVMLYHPCANKLQIQKLTNLVKKCLYRHIISPYNLLSPQRPLVLLAWGKKIQMSVVSSKVVTNFINENALHGPEDIANDGQYTYGLINHAKYVSDRLDSSLCPNKNAYIKVNRIIRALSTKLVPLVY